MASPKASTTTTECPDALSDEARYAMPIEGTPCCVVTDATGITVGGRTMQTLADRAGMLIAPPPPEQDDAKRQGAPTRRQPPERARTGGRRNNGSCRGRNISATPV